MKRKDAVNLYAILRELKNGAMSKEGLTDYILMRLKLKQVFDEFERARAEISEQTKSDSPEEWQHSFMSVIEKWLSETEEIDTHVISQEDFIEMVSKNELTGIIEDNLYKDLVNEKNKN